MRLDVVDNSLKLLTREGKQFSLIGAGLFLIILLAYVGWGLDPISREGEAIRAVPFEVDAGEGYGQIIGDLHEERLIRSPFILKIYGVFKRSVAKLKPGVYRLNSAMSGKEILDKLISGDREKVELTIPEGDSVYDIDRKLAAASVIKKGELVRFAESIPIEGKLFPDTYIFFIGSRVEEIVSIFLTNFREKAEPLLGGGREAEEALILASLLEKEIPDFEDRKIAAGILKKRLSVGMPLQVDATVCYIKEAFEYPEASGCYPLYPLDFKNPSPYNTYVHKGLPPGPIANPGVRAIVAALHPKSSPYWFYLSDPRTKKTVWSRDIDEHGRNKAKYLSN